MNCPHCGNPITPADRFCPGCGADLGVTETIISQAPPPTEPSPEETIISRAPLPPSPAYEPPSAPPTYPTAPPPEGEKGRRNTIVIVAVALILLCCFCLITVLIGYLLLSGDIVDISLALSLV